MEAADVVPERPFQLYVRSPFAYAVLDTPGDVGKASAGVGQHDLQLRKPVEQPGGDELGRSGGGFERKTERVVDESRPGQPLRARVMILHAVERMKQQRVSQFLAAGEDREV